MRALVGLYGGITSQNRVCIVVGAGPGIGYATARRFGRNCSHRLALISRNSVTLDALVRRLRDEGIEVEPYLADAGDSQVLRGALEEICATMGTPEVLIYNAARAVSRLDPEDLLTGHPSLIMDDYEVSVGGVLTCLRVLTPQMREIGGGTMIVSSRPPAAVLSSRFISHSLTITALDALVDAAQTDPRTFPNRVVHVRLPAELAPRKRAPSVAQLYWSLAHPPKKSPCKG